VGHAEVLPDGRVRLHVAWNDPIGGHGHDTFSRCTELLSGLQIHKCSCVNGVGDSN
jgi:hypothetical protein